MSVSQQQVSGLQFRVNPSGYANKQHPIYFGTPGRPVFKQGRHGCACSLRPNPQHLKLHLGADSGGVFYLAQFASETGQLLLHARNHDQHSWI
jgi:hypothetical protein